MKSKINTIEAAFEYTGRNPKALPDVSMLPEQDREITVDKYKYLVLVEAMNKEANDGKPWMPDYTDNNWKYEARFWIKASKKKPSGWAFGDSRCDYSSSLTTAGSRLCFKELSSLQHVQNKFKKLCLSVFLDYR